MGAWQSADLKEERIRLKWALEVLFDYLDHRNTAHDDPPPEVEQAMGFIIAYYTARLKNVVKLFPSDYFARSYDSRDLFYHAWSALWLNGHRIKNRTPAGVCAWLKNVIRNHKLDLRDKLRRFEPIGWQSAEEFESLLEQTGMLLANIGLLPDFYSEDEVYFRYQLLEAFIARALPKLCTREQRVIHLASAKYSLEEIARDMQFPSRNAVSSFKKRAFEKLAKRLYILFLRDLDHPATGLHEKDIIAEWIQRFHRQGEKKRCVIRTR